MIIGIGYNRLLEDNKKMRKILQECMDAEDKSYLLDKVEEIIKNTEYVEEE